MYDSRTEASRLPGRHVYGHADRQDCREPGRGDYIDYGTPLSRRLCVPTAKREAIAEGLADYLAGPDLEPTLDCEVMEWSITHDTPTRWEMDRLHGEALGMDREFTYPEEPLADWERELVDWSWDNMGTHQPFVFVPNTEGGREVLGLDDNLVWSDEIEMERLSLELEDRREAEARWDEEYGGYTHDDHWMPFARGQEVYDLMDAGFHVITPNKISTDPAWVRDLRERKQEMAKVDEATERLKALNAAAQQRERQQRLAAQLGAHSKAKVTRPGGNPFYDTSLDPISPDFSMTHFKEGV